MSLAVLYVCMYIYITMTLCILFMGPERVPHFNFSITSKQALNLDHHLHK